MAELRLDAIARKVGGTIVRGSPSLVFREFGIDSRETKPGGLFFAIVARRDGHDFVADAARRGAAGAVVSKDVAGVGGDFALVRVPDTLAALQTLAREVLAEHRPRVVGITGSVGKTTTKEFTAALLGRKYRVLKSEGNFNNHLGLALSLLRLEDSDEIAVLEMGMSAPGEIRLLTGIAPPDVAVITNVSPVHLEFLKTMEAIAEAKAEILEGLKEGGAAVLNGDDPYVEKIAQTWPGRKIFFGFSRACDIRLDDVQRMGFDGFKFTIFYGKDKKRSRFSFLSETSLCNLLAALGAAFALSLPLETIADAIQALKPAPGRGLPFRLAKKIVLIDDSYNSNPAALESALQSFTALPARRKIAVVGDMLELGETGPRFHEEAGEQAARLGWDILVTVGPLARQAAAGAVSAGLSPARILSFASSEEAAENIPPLLREGDLVLVKGSRGVRTEKIVEKIKTALKET